MCICVCVCAHINLCMCVCMQVNTCVHICGAKGQYQVVLSQYSLPVFVIIAVCLLLFETGPLIFTWSSLIYLSCLSSEPQGSTCSCFFRAIIMSLCYHIHLLLFGFLGSNSGLHAGTENTFYPLSYLPNPHWKGSLQTLVGEKRNLIGEKKRVFLDKLLPYGFSTNTAIVTCVRKK